MKRFGAILLLLILTSGHIVRAMEEKTDTLAHEQKIAEWKRINEQVWKPFSEAFAQLDVKLYLALHTDDFLRVGYGKILTKKQYVQEQTRGFERYAKQGITLNIDFRLIERIVSNDAASERGIYCTIANKGTDKEQRSYGKFHVLMRKEKGTWKITMDYDSDEKRTINAKSFEEAFALDDWGKY